MDCRRPVRSAFHFVDDSMVREMFAHKTIAVIGMARTGMAVAEVLSELGAHVVLYDHKPADALKPQLSAAARFGVEVRTGVSDVDFDGVDMLVPSPGVPATSPMFVEAQSRGVEIVSEIELAYRIARAPILAITGTNGKTTTTVLLGRIMEADGRETYIAGNVAAGEIKLPLIMAAHRASADAVIVAEISTFQLEWISSFRPKVAALLNISIDHADRHSTFDEYADLKAKLFKYQQPDDYAVLNLDNANVMSRTDQVSSEKLYFSRQKAVEQGAFVEDSSVKVRIGDKVDTACNLSDIPLPGSHNLENVLAASCAAIAFGVRPESISRAIREFNAVEHRMEPVATVNGVTYINNSMCTNVDAFVRSIEAVDGSQIVIAGGKHKGGSLDEVADAINRCAKHLVLIGVSADEIEDVVRKAGYSNITRAESMQDAVEKSSTLAANGDTVILAPGCASFDMFSGFEERGQVFKDAVKQLALKGSERG